MIKHSCYIPSLLCPILNQILTIKKPQIPFINQLKPWYDLSFSINMYKHTFHIYITYQPWLSMVEYG